MGADQVSMGEGQEKVAREKNGAAFINGGWVILQNCHLGTDYMNEVEETLMKTPEIHTNYRLWITCEITSRFPIGLLQMCIKVTLEPPAGLKASLHRTYTTMIIQETLDKVDHEKWRTLLYTVAVLHSIVQERRKFGAIGWCVPYEFNNSDLDASLLFLEKHLSSTILVGLPLTWNTIQYMIAEVQYGGRITDDLDRDLINTYAAKWFCDEIFKPTFCFNTHSADFNYQIPADALDISSYRDYIETIPPVDSPLIFGLHPNADITYRIKEAAEMLTTIVETQPKESSAAAGKSVDEQVKESATDLLGKLPPDLVEEVFRAQIQKMKGPPRMEERGFGAPLHIFLFQELQRLQNIIDIVRKNLDNLVMAIDGTVVMTVELLEDLNCVFDPCIKYGLFCAYAFPPSLCLSWPPSEPFPAQGFEAVTPSQMSLPIRVSFLRPSTTKSNFRFAVQSLAPSQTLPTFAPERAGYGSNERFVLTGFDLSLGKSASVNMNEL